jgi:hypothetical protein
VRSETLIPMPACSRDMLALTASTASGVRAVTRRGLIVVGDGAMPELTVRLAANLRAPVRPARSPRLAALDGAGLAAIVARRHPANAAA